MKSTLYSLLPKPEDNKEWPEQMKSKVVETRNSSYQTSRVVKSSIKSMSALTLAHLNASQRHKNVTNLATGSRNPSHVLRPPVAQIHASGYDVTFFPTHSSHSFHSLYSKPTASPSYLTSSPLPSFHVFSQLLLLPFQPAFLIKLISASSFVQPCSSATLGRYVAP